MRLPSLAFAFVLLAACSTVRADDADIRKVIDSQFAAVVAAMPSGDSAVIDKAVATGFQFTDVFGRAGGAATWSGRSKTLLGLVTDPKLASLVSTVTVKGNTTTAFLKVKVTGTGKD